MKPSASNLTLLEIGITAFTVGGTAWLWARSLQPEESAVAEYVARALAPVFFFVLSAYYNDLYDLRSLSNFDAFGERLPRTLGVSFLLDVLLYTVFPYLGSLHEPFPPGLWGVLIIVIMVAPLRLLLWLILKSYPFSEQVLIVGANTLGETIARELIAYSPVSSTILGFVAEDEPRQEEKVDEPAPRQCPILGSLSQLARLIEVTRPHRIIVAITDPHNQALVRELIEARMDGIAVEDGIEVHERLSGKLAVEYLTPDWLFFCKDFRNTRWRMAWRRAVSLLVAVVGLILMTPLMLLIALIIKFESRGSVFFLQERAGLHGKPFRLVKFRTMRTAPVAEASTASVWRRDDESRITRVGKWLRKLRLDELPQFVNILRGDMNLIGPRPEIAGNIATMMAQIPYYSLRLTVRPGITGWAQVKHGYAVSQEDVTEKLRYDLYYVKHMSLWLDIRIMFDTVKILFCSPGSQEGGTPQQQPPYLTPQPQRAMA